MRDELGIFYEDQCFSSLFSLRGQPALAPWKLALITVMQFVEGLTDRQAESCRMMGTDGIYLLDAIWSELAPEWLRQMEAVEILRKVWIQQFYLESGSLKLREPSNCPPPARLINSPYDPDAHLGNKRSLTWTGS